MYCIICTYVCTVFDLVAYEAASTENRLVCTVDVYSTLHIYIIHIVRFFLYVPARYPSRIPIPRLFFLGKEMGLDSGSCHVEPPKIDGELHVLYVCTSSYLADD